MYFLVTSSWDSGKLIHFLFKKKNPKNQTKKKPNPDILQMRRLACYMSQYGVIHNINLLLSPAHVISKYNRNTF